MTRVLLSSWEAAVLWLAVAGHIVMPRAIHV